MVEAPVLTRGTPARAATTPRPLELLALVPKPAGVSPGQRFRLEQWAPQVEARHGIALRFAPFESPGLTRVLYEPGHYAEKALRVVYDFVRRAGVVAKARRYDAVIVYREAALLGPAIYERILSQMRVPLLLDFDDAIWADAAQPGINGIFTRLHFWSKTDTTCRLAARVIVGNSYLADYARRHTRNVSIVPTSIDLAKYPLQPELPDDGRFVVVWSGSTHTLPHFEHAREALETLAQRRRIVVKVICNRPPERPIAGAENEFVPWSERGEAESIGAAHVGIMPLPDSVFTRGKCGLKALQYMATGRAVVISPVGMNNDLVRHGVNGYLAATTAETVAALDELAASPDLRRRIGLAGRRTIEQAYSAEVVADRFAEAVRLSVH